MFSLMGNCWSSRKSGPRRQLTLAVLGLDNAGKTVTANILQGDSLQTAPTIGFQKGEISFGKYDLTLFDLGGGKKIRAIWKKYLAEVYGVVYIVDASDSSRIEESTAVFKELLENPKVTRKPVLVLANKQDVDGALDEMDICDQMKLEEVVNANKCPCRVEMCSAIKGTGKKKDQRIKEGLEWLCDMINVDFNTLDDRVQADRKQQEIERKKDMEERRARVQKIKAERERKEAAERERLGIKEPESADEDTIDGDPFKRLDYEELKQKEARLKAEKKKKAALDQNDNKAAEAEPNKVTNRLSGIVTDDDDEEIIITSPSPRHSKLPPLRNRNWQLEDISTQKSTHPDTELGMLDHHKENKLSAFDNHLNPIENGYSVHPNDKRGKGRQLVPLVPGTCEDKPEKKRKRRLKKNKLVPVTGDLDTSQLSDRSGEGRIAPLPWEENVQPAQSIRNTSADLQGQLSHSAYNWGLVEDLPEPITNREYRNARPNFDSDDIVT